MILVVGGTGTLGRLLVPRLVARGEQVRVLTRDHKRAAPLLGDQVEAVVGDLHVPADVERAVSGTATVVAAAHGFVGPGGVSPASVDRDGNTRLIDAAARAGADVVLVSVVGAAEDHPMELFRMKAAAERHLRSSSASWTIVRAHAFLETWTGVVEQTAARSGRPLVFGRGENPVNFVSADDVAEILAQAVVDPAARGRSLDVGGPENLTMDQLARLVQVAADRTATPRHVPRAALRVMAATVGRIRPEQGRMARAALVMDTADLTFMPSADALAPYPVPTITAAQLLAQRATQVPEH